MAEHLHNVIDDDLHFKIDPSTRRISRTSEEPIVLVQHDHRSERISFEIPRVIDGHDMTLCDKVRIHFLNFEASNTDAKFAGVYESTDLGVLDGDDETLLFTWLVNMDATGYAGPLNFAISFVCTGEELNDDGTTKIVDTYRWNTLPNTEDIVVSDGMDHGADFTYDYGDVIDDWINNIQNMGRLERLAITEHADNTKLSVEQSIINAGGSAKQSIREYAAELKETFNDQTFEEMNVVVQETGTATDKVMSQDATTKAIDAAKTFATSEATTVRSDLNGRCDDIEEAFSKLSTYKRLYPDDNRYYKLESNKLYHICHVNDGQTTTGWRMSLRCLVQGWSIQKSNNTTASVDNIEHMIELPEYRDRAPDMYGFQIRVIDDGKLKYRSDTGISATVSYEIIRGHDVNTFTDTYKVVDYHADATTQGYVLLKDTETYTRNGLYATIAGAVYEINESPSGATFTVKANGISDISKTGISGLTDTYTVVLDDGTKKTFTVTNGGMGPEGKSAYEIALKNGFFGTEPDWLESLKGRDGKPGEKGDPGDVANYDFRIPMDDFTTEYLQTLNIDSGTSKSIYVYGSFLGSALEPIMRDVEIPYGVNELRIDIPHKAYATLNVRNENVYGAYFSTKLVIGDKCSLDSVTGFTDVEVRLPNNAGAFEFVDCRGIEGLLYMYASRTFTNCSFISNVHGGGTFTNCSVISNIYGGRTPPTYTDCTHVDSETCAGYEGSGSGTGGKANVFAGTWAEYEAANAAGEIPDGMVVLITDEDDAGTTALLGQAILGQMLLG